MYLFKQKYFPSRKTVITVIVIAVTIFCYF